jgi:hypothetical protein
MKTPFTAEEFLTVFRNYNESIFPMQIIFYLFGFVVIYFIFKSSPLSGKIISVILSFLWFWMGVVYHIVFFTAINKAAWLFGIIFILQGTLVLTISVFQDKLSFKYHNGSYGVTAFIMVSFALIIYPVIGYALGHRYPSSPTFGLPCPITIFTFGLLLLDNKKYPLIILIIPFAWSVIGFIAAINFGILEDTALLTSGLLTVPAIIIRNRKFKQVRS